jgi:hypothetical protein
MPSGKVVKMLVRGDKLGPAPMDIGNLEVAWLHSNWKHASQLTGSKLNPKPARKTNACRRMKRGSNMELLQGVMRNEFT